MVWIWSLRLTLCFVRASQAVQAAAAAASHINAKLGISGGGQLASGPAAVLDMFGSPSGNQTSEVIYVPDRMVGLCRYPLASRLRNWLRFNRFLNLLVGHHCISQFIVFHEYHTWSPMRYHIIMTVALYWARIAMSNFVGKRIRCYATCELLHK